MAQGERRRERTEGGRLESEGKTGKDIRKK